MKKGRIAGSLIAVLICFVCLSSAKLMKKKETPKEAVKQEEIKKENVKEEVIPAEKENKETTATDEKVIVKTGAVIIDGRYIEPPYVIEARSNGIWINGVLAEKMGISRKEKQKQTRDTWVKSELYARYYELLEEHGPSKAKDLLKEQVLKEKEIRGFVIKDMKSISEEDIEVVYETEENQIITLNKNPSPVKKNHMLNCLISAKCTEWQNAAKENKKKKFNELIKILEEQKKKTIIQDYLIDRNYNIMRVIYTDPYFGSMRFPLTQINYSENILSNEMCEILDREERLETALKIQEYLKNGGFEVFSKGRQAYRSQFGEMVIKEVREILSRKNTGIEEKKREIKKVYRLGEMQEKYLTEILENFNK